MGRPKGITMPIGMQRVRINTTIRPETMAAIEKFKREGESLGVVIDRWARRALRKAEKIPT
jgi:hypothetical protein